VIVVAPLIVAPTKASTPRQYFTIKPSLLQCPSTIQINNNEDEITQPLRHPTPLLNDTSP